MEGVFICQNIGSWCEFCGGYPEYACDAPVIGESMPDDPTEENSCSRHICEDCAVEVDDDRHYCPDCNRADEARIAWRKAALDRPLGPINAERSAVLSKSSRVFHILRDSDGGPLLTACQREVTASWTLPTPKHRQCARCKRDQPLPAWNGAGFT